MKASKNGLLSCGIKLPECLRHSDIYVSPVGNGDELPLENWSNDPLFHVIMTPAATISDIHDDSMLSASFLVQIYGEKILFTWPASETNRKFFSECHGTKHGLKLREAIEKMTDGFRVTILYPGFGVKIDPGMIHAVVSISNSVIGCWEFVDAKWLKDSPIEGSSEWELNLFKNRDRLPNDDDPKNIINGLNCGLNLWRCLALKLEKEEGDVSEDKTSQVHHLVKSLETQITGRNEESGHAMSNPSGGKRKRTTLTKPGTKC